MAAIIALAAWSYSDYQKSSLPDGIRDLVLANIEALADEETDGTRVVDCFINSDPGIASAGWYLFCYGNTSADMISPCGALSYGRPSGTSKCIAGK